MFHLDRVFRVARELLRHLIVIDSKTVNVLGHVALNRAPY